jgi:hypothetical protein
MDTNTRMIRVYSCLFVVENNYTDFAVTGINQAAKSD